jgi:hypothetical protein
MKNKLFILSLLVTVPFFFHHCKSTKSISDTTGAEEIKLPLSESKYQTDKDYFRAVQSGLSPDLATAKKIALQNAKTELASNVQTTIKAVTDNYTNQRTVGDRMEFENKFEELSRQVTNQKLSNVKVLGEKTFREQDGKYTYWVAIEMPKDEILDDISSEISKDEKMQLDFDKYQYEQILEQEMEKFENR